MPRRQKNGKKFPSQSLESRRTYIKNWKLKEEAQDPKTCHRKADCLSYAVCLEREAFRGNASFDCPANCVEYGARKWDYYGPGGLTSPFDDRDSIGELGGLR